MREDIHPSVSYVRDLYAPEDELLNTIQKNTPDNIAKMQIGADEGKLLDLLINMHGVKTIVEIGTLIGYSTVWMARALPEDGHIHTINKDSEQVEQAKQHFASSEVAEKITQHQGDAEEVLADLTGSFDMVFIDADKLNYSNYLNWAEQNIRKGGLIVADNTFLFGTVWQDSPPENRDPTSASAWQAMREFNSRLADTERYKGTILPTAEGLSVAIKLF